MKRNVLAAALITLTIGFASQPAKANNDYGVINKTGMDITHLYIGGSEEENWANDILGKDVLENGDECGIEFDAKDDRCDFDIKITDSTGKDWVVYKVDLCKYTKITFTKQGGKVMWSAR